MEKSYRPEPQIITMIFTEWDPVKSSEISTPYFLKIYSWGLFLLRAFTSIKCSPTSFLKKTPHFWRLRLAMDGLYVPARRFPISTVASLSFC